MARRSKSTTSPSTNPAPQPTAARIEYFQPKYTPFLVAKWQQSLPQPSVLRPAAKSATASTAQISSLDNPDKAFATDPTSGLWPDTKFGLWKEVDGGDIFAEPPIPAQKEYHGIAKEFFNRTVDGTANSVALDGTEYPEGIPYYQLKKSDGSGNFADTLWYSLDIKAGTSSIVTKAVQSSTGTVSAVPVTSPIAGYGPGYVNGDSTYESAATFPGPLLKTRVGQPVVVRNHNETNEWYSTHLHGAHTPSHSDGYATFVTEAGKYRDYYYPNTVPMSPEDKDGNGLYDDPDFSESPSNLWYHDHGIDLTDKHVLRGAAGFWQAFDDLEIDLVRTNKLPGWWSTKEFNEEAFMANKSPYDLPLVLSDLRFNADGSIYYNPDDHDGTLGDVTAINGAAYPVMTVEPTSYRFRILDGAVARFYNLKLSDSRTDIPDPSFIGIGSDTWMYEKAIQRDSIYLSPARRADVVIDFSKYKEGDVVYMENILEQTDGKGPKGTADDPNPIAGDKILKFVVGPRKENAPPKASVAVGDMLRPHIPIRPEEVTATRTFEFHRSNGHWLINQIDYRPEVAHITPTNGAVERWVLKNNSGGWAHPVHIHLESHQVEIENGHAPRPENAGKVDTSVLDPNGEMVVLVRFRTFGGPFMMHCHILAHEDYMMMANIDVTIDPNKPDESIISTNHAPPSMNPWTSIFDMNAMTDTVATAGLGSVDGHHHGTGAQGSEDCPDCPEHAALDRGPHSGLPWFQQDRLGSAAHSADGHGVDGHSADGHSGHAHGADGAEHCELEASPAKRITYGSDQHDCIQGTSNRDRIRAGRGHDELTAAEGDDRMWGGRGHDILHGGRGSDWMKGGRGRDLFCFDVNEMNYGDIDTIADFQGKRGDRIELLGADAISKFGEAFAFRFIDAAAFSGQKGEIRFAGGFFQADIDGDRQSDLMVRLAGVNRFKSEWLLSDGQGL